MSDPVVLGIDVGGSGIKGAPVDVRTGQLTADRLRLTTPQPSEPVAVAATTAEVVRHHQWIGPVGCTFPAIVRHGVVLSAANVDPSWIGVDGRALFTAETGCPVTLLNDADAAGLAEVRFGAGAGVSGVVLMLTFGTGIGSALFVDGTLVPNTELGHLQLSGHVAEDRAAARLVERDEIKLRKWTRRVRKYLQHLERLFSPDLFIFGGGISKRFDDFAADVAVTTPVVPARLRNNAGIVGAALAAHENI